MSSSKTTIDHEEIKKWVEERDGRPSKVKTSTSGGILRIDFAEPDDKLEQIEWDEFFKIFDENKLAFLYQEETSGNKTSRFSKFIAR